VHQDPGQHRDRDQCQHLRQQQRERQQPQAVQGVRETGLGPGLDVGRTARHHGRDGQRAEETRDRVSGALGDEFGVVAGARAAVHTVHGGRGEQALRGGDDREGEDGRDDRGVRETRELPGPRHLYGRQQVADLERLQLHAGQRGDRDAEADRDQRGRDPVQRARHLLPQEAQADRDDAEQRGDHRLPVDQDAGEQSRDAGHVLDRGARGLRVGHRVRLTEHQRQPDAGQHALDDGQGDRLEHPAQAYDTQDDLEEAGEQHDHPEHGHAVLGHGLRYQRGQPRGGPADL
jgi:hypothetical protein